MDLAKSLFTPSSEHEGYSGGKEGVAAPNADTLSEDEEQVFTDDSKAGTPIHAGQGTAGKIPTPGGPFSALTPSMWPSTILTELNTSSDDDPNQQPDYR